MAASIHRYLLWGDDYTTYGGMIVSLFIILILIAMAYLLMCIAAMFKQNWGKVFETALCAMILCIELVLMAVIDAPTIIFST